MGFEVIDPTQHARTRVATEVVTVFRIIARIYRTLRHEAVRVGLRMSRPVDSSDGLSTKEPPS